MAASIVTADVHGEREFAAGSRRLAGVIDRDADPALLKAADHVAALVRGRVPRLTGRLAGSAQASIGAEGAETTLGGGGVPYAGWIEYGGSRGRPFVPDGRYLYPTALSATSMVARTAEQAAENSIGGFVWPTVL